ncbi:hypothetical protein Sjap_006527 [Stephania japonica]|uniref:Uncharacterized protein n=1 Tax=Stephania japonica TaxID=461633 RepID=A0AAP0K7L8_9MAGN
MVENEEDETDEIDDDESLLVVLNHVFAEFFFPGPSDIGKSVVHRMRSQFKKLREVRFLGLVSLKSATRAGHGSGLGQPNPIRDDPTQAFTWRAIDYKAAFGCRLFVGGEGELVGPERGGAP